MVWRDVTLVLVEEEIKPMRVNFTVAKHNRVIINRGIIIRRIISMASLSQIETRHLQFNFFILQRIFRMR